MGSPLGLPIGVLGWSCCLLESYAHAELNLPHTHRGSRRGIRFDVLDLARGGAAAIHASVAGEVQHRMVEQVKHVHTELRFDAFRNCEGLGNRHVVVERMRAPVGVKSHIADLTASGQGEWSGNRPRRSAAVRCAGDVRW
jgi:hypothetical protein